jgi:hypothetical protein
MGYSSAYVGVLGSLAGLQEAGIVCKLWGIQAAAPHRTRWAEGERVVLQCLGNRNEW